MAIRMAVAGDASRVAALHCASWRDAYANVLERAYLEGPIEADRRAFWSGRFAEPDPARTVFVADAPGESLVGFVRIQQDVDAEWGSLIDNLHVAPALRGEGVGAQLMRTAALSLSGGSRTLAHPGGNGRRRSPGVLARPVRADRLMTPHFPLRSRASRL